MVEVLPRTRRGWLLAAFAVALAVLGVRVVQQYRYDHRDEFRQEPVAWHRFEVGEDQRTFTFFPYGGVSCQKPHHVELEGTDPITATAIYEIHTRKDGQMQFCTLALTELPPVSITLDEPLEPGTTVVDGTTPDDFFCPVRTIQRVGDLRGPYRGPGSC